MPLGNALARKVGPFSRSGGLPGLMLPLLLTLHLALLGLFQLTSLDTWWHLKQGELYVTTASLPAQDPFAFTTQGREWIKFSWLADIVFYLIYAQAGAAGLVLLRVTLLFLIALLLYRLLRDGGLHSSAAVMLVFLASLALRFRLFVRPELLSFPLLLAVMAILLGLQKARPGTAFLLLPIQLLWANVHASFVFGIGVPALVLLANLLPPARMAPGWGRLRLDRVRTGCLAAAVACLPLVSLLNPQGASLLAFPFRQNRMDRLTLFGEWVEIWHLPRIDPAWWETVIVFGLLLLAFLATAALLLAREGRLDPVGWGLVLSMGIYAAFRNRALPYFVLAFLPVFAPALVRLAERHLGPSDPGPRRWRERAGALACVLVLSASILDQALLTPRFPPGIGVRTGYFPEGAAAFLERHRLDGRVFNAYKFGGYLLWRRWPANQVLIDGRYDAVLFEESLLERYLEALHSRTALQEIARVHEIEILLLDADPNRRVAYLDQDPDWARVYWDPVAEIFLRRGGRHSRLIAAHEYRLTRPDASLDYLVAYRDDPPTREAAIAELRRAVAENPENDLAWLGLAQEYGPLGPSALAPRLEALTRAAALLARAPAAAWLYGERAEVLLRLERFAEAEGAAQEALRLQEDLLLPRSVLAAVAERRRDWAEASRQLRALRDRLAPGDPRVPEVQERLEAVDRRRGDDRSH